ncbi:MAG: phosphoesterase [Oscillospiraceae bacterium]|nr:phosphoesterase [Oscillospiraceae bacterium]
MTIRYIADMHFDDEDIIAYDGRPFDSVAEMNEAMTDRWNDTVRDEDMTWILGDFCAGDEARWRELLTSLRGRKGLILGNHDDKAAAESVSDLLEEIAEYKEITDGDCLAVLCHYPIPSFRGHYFGNVHLYGHVHESFEAHVAENSKRLLKNLYVRRDVCRMANVGAMMPYMDYTPRSLDELKDIL